jgi:succinate dehydrogenase/fumarate reductase flavoprotein subunit
VITVDHTPTEADVLICGGGIAGLMAAIRAADAGAKVVVAEKAHTRRSGSGASGNDHFLCYLPEIQGKDLQPLLRLAQDSILGKFNDLSLLIRLFQESFARVKDWENWGIPMRPHGDWEFTGHAFPGKPRLWLKFEGADQKITLTREALKRKVQIQNRLIITDVITGDGGVIGAIGLSLQEEQPILRIFRAKAVILTTGSANRLYPPVTPGMMFNTVYCPSCTGSGRAVALRAGATLVNMEIPNRHAGPKYFARAGKASWIGIFTDASGKAVGPFVEKPTKDSGDITADIWNSVFIDMIRSGRGPVYMDCTGTSAEDLEYMMWGLRHEGAMAMLNHMKAEGIDVRRDRVEFTRYEPFLTGRGIEINEQGETTIEGLFAAGDEVGNLRAALSGAAVFGWIAGERAASRAKGISSFPTAKESPLVEERVDFFSEILERKEGAGWQEVNLALQQIMNDYAGEVRSETLLNVGVKYLRELREKARQTVRASNAHTLMRVLETLDLIDCGEAVFLSALERKESRPPHIRSDCPFTNPLLQDRFVTISREKGDWQVRWRDRR